MSERPRRPFAVAQVQAAAAAATNHKGGSLGPKKLPAAARSAPTTNRMPPPATQPPKKKKEIVPTPPTSPVDLTPTQPTTPPLGPTPFHAPPPFPYYPFGHPGHSSIFHPHHYDSAFLQMQRQATLNARESVQKAVAQDIKEAQKTYYLWSAEAEEALISIKTNDENLVFSKKPGTEGTAALSSVERKRNWDSVLQALHDNGHKPTLQQVKGKWEGLWLKYRHIKRQLAQTGGAGFERISDSFIGYEKLDTLWSESVEPEMSPAAIEEMGTNEPPASPSVGRSFSSTPVDLTRDDVIDSPAAASSSSSSFLSPPKRQSPSEPTTPIGRAPKRQKAAAAQAADTYAATQASSAAAAVVRNKELMDAMGVILRDQQSRQLHSLDRIADALTRIAEQGERKV